MLRNCRYVSPALQDNTDQKGVHIAAHPCRDLRELDPVSHGQVAPVPHPHHPGPHQVGLGTHHDALLASQLSVLRQVGQNVFGQI